ncbi:WD repeat and FYVE domain-containing protein 2 isoform X1 [Oryzias melastigma]|uniref:WD repeat and FYVE domain containing 2 n=1 Tax=Oryzias melastigma TaxID=30732 RepID=A0A3B3CBD1_ORYME|nr:WD repeat and FYVE domain-containing protein 2 isoform X1 [Oryzias melastigma]
MADGAPPPVLEPCLLNEIRDFHDVVITAVFLPKGDGLISLSEDGTIQVWLKRKGDQYWPSIHHTMQTSCSCMAFSPETRRLFVGTVAGNICEFSLSEDYNKMTPALTYSDHQGTRMTVVLFVLEVEWLLSTRQDKNLTWHCSESGQLLGTYNTTACVSGLQFDVETRHAFVGDQSGQVTILKLEQDRCSLVTTFKGHTGNITALCWDPIHRMLFSGSTDQSIIMWDIGGRTGTAIELQGHKDKIQGLCYASLTHHLISCSSDGRIVIWDMNVTREETPEWLDSDSCQKCEKPFFWNFKQMWDRRRIGLRQHHCRKCGEAVCAKCSSKSSPIPLMGFEFPVRVCNTCHESIPEKDRASTTSFHNSEHNIVHMHYEPTIGTLLTSGTDKVIKIWEMNPVLKFPEDKQLERHSDN